MTTDSMIILGVAFGVSTALIATPFRNLIDWVIGYKRNKPEPKRYPLLPPSVKRAADARIIINEIDTWANRGNKEQEAQRWAALSDYAKGLSTWDGIEKSIVKYNKSNSFIYGMSAEQAGKSIVERVNPETVAPHSKLDNELREVASRFVPNPNVMKGFSNGGMIKPDTHMDAMI